MHWIDIGIIIIVILSTVVGIYRGFIKEVLTLLSWVIGITLAYNFYHLLSPYLEFIKIPIIRSVVAGVIIFISVIMLLSVVNFILSKSLGLVGFKWFDRSLGAGFGVVRAIALMSILVIFLSPDFSVNSKGKNISISSSDKWSQGSLLYPKVERVADGLQKQLPDDWVQKVTKYLL